MARDGARRTGTELTFRAVAKPHPDRWSFHRRDGDVLRLDFTTREGRDFTLDMTRGETRCINRVARAFETLDHGG